jgi:predicted PurR-regulated permease PerM
MSVSNQPARRRLRIYASEKAVLLAAALALAWYVRTVLMLVFAGVLFALFLQSLASWCSCWSRLSYRWALFFTVIVLVAMVCLATWLFGNRIADQAARLSETLPASIQQMRQQMEHTEEGKLVSSQFTKIGNWLTSSGAVSQLTSGAMTAFDGLVALLIVGFIGLYGALSPSVYTRGAIKLVVPHRRGDALAIFDVLARDLRHWMLGHLTTMVIVGVLAAVGLSLLSIPEAVVLGLLAFFAELIPYMGPVLASLPAILLGWSQSPMSALYVMLLYLGIHLVEGYLLFPWIMRRAIKLPPALTICGVVFFGLIGGLLGAILATPLTLVLMILVRKLYVESYLEKLPAPSE